VNASCKSWNETRCVKGVVHPDYSNPKRIQATQLQERVLNLDKFNTSIYKCPVKSFYYKDNNEEEASVIVFKSDDITNQIWPNRVLVSSQAGGIVHKINFTVKYDAFTFSYATLASLTDLIKYADFRDHPIDVSNSSDNKWTEDLPSDNLYSFLENNTSPLNHIYNINNVSVFKCLGRSKTQNNTSFYSTYILIESTNLTQDLSEDDFIYGNQTLGFLERTIVTDRIRVGSGEEKLLIQTELVRGDELNNNSMFKFDANLNNKSELICNGRSNSNSSMFIVDLSTFAYNLSQNVIIPGRASKRFAMKIIEKRILLNGYILFECIPITYINISNTNTRYLIEQTFSESYDKTFKLPFPGGDLSLTTSLIPSLKVSFDFDFNLVDFFRINYVGAEVGLDVNVRLSGNLDLTDVTLSSPKISLVKDKTLKSFAVLLAGIPIPGRLSLDIDDEVSVRVKDASSIKTSLDASVNLRTTISSRWAKLGGLTSNVDASGPNLNRFNFVPTDYKETGNTASLTIKNTLTPTLTVKLPSALSDSELDSIVEKLPIPNWLKNNSLVNIGDDIKEEIKEYLKLSVSLDVPVYVQGVLKLCSFGCATDKDKPLGASFTAGTDKPKVSLSISKFNKDVNVPLSRKSELGRVCLSKPSIIPCKDTDANGKCLCKCPDGTQPQLVSNVYKCLCKCDDGRESNQLDDGSCNCTCKCPDDSKSFITSYGCICPCKCKDCKESVKYLDKNDKLVTSLSGLNEEGCLCPSDEIDPKCKWVNCEIKCPPNPPGGGGGGGGSSSGDGDVHFRTFDGRSYDFQGFGEYTYCKSETSDLDIQIRTLWPYRGSGVSLIGGVAVKLGIKSKLTVFIQKNSTITIRLNGKIINDSIIPFQDKIDDKNEGITVNINRNGISIERKYFWSIGIGLSIYRLSLNLFLRQNPFSFFSYPSAYRGLCGNYDSNRFNDLQGPDGTLYSNVNDFGYSWKINPSNNASQSTWLYGVSNFHLDDILDERFHDVSNNKASKNKLISIENATEICLKNSLSGTLLDNCVLDITETGDVSFARDNVYNTDSCPSQCSFNGNCIGLNQCQCFDGWSGSLCDIASCKFQCGKHGSCQNGVCKCDIGWEGDNCTTSVSCEQVNNCTDLNHGVCVGMNKCQCFSGYEGVNCSKSISCELLSNCSGNMKFKKFFFFKLPFICFILKSILSRMKNSIFVNVCQMTLF
jgi:hypothetical protein